MSRVHTSLNLEIEQNLWSKGISNIAGADEVGRGCFAGPVFVASVIFPKNHQPIPGVNDSKKLTLSNRLHLYHQIKSQSLYYSISKSSVTHINNHGIVSSITKALNKSLIKLPKLDYFLFDGNQTPSIKSLKPNQIQTIIKGDSICYSIAAASILAKVERDLYMQKLHHQFPHYDWFNNKGYGTKAHRQALLTHGSCPHHRTQFIQKTLNPHQKL